MGIVESIVNNIISSIPPAQPSPFVETQTANVFAYLNKVWELITMQTIEPVQIVESESVNSNFDSFFSDVWFYLYTLASNYTPLLNKNTAVTNGINLTTTYNTNALTTTYTALKSESDKIALVGNNYMNSDYYNFATVPSGWQFTNTVADTNARKATLLPQSSGLVNASLVAVNASAYSTNPLTLLVKTDGTAQVTYSVGSPFNTLQLTCDAPAGAGTLLQSITYIKGSVSQTITMSKPVELFTGYDAKIFLPYIEADYVTLNLMQNYQTAYLSGNRVVQYAPIVINSATFSLNSYPVNGSFTFFVSGSSSIYTVLVRRYVDSSTSVYVNINAGNTAFGGAVTDTYSQDVTGVNSFSVTISLSSGSTYTTPIIKDIAIVWR